jgi:branched-chain amino acid transport system permease protein
MSLHEFGLQLLNGLTFAALLFLVSSGFTLIFGLMRIVNLAQGSLYLIGGYIGLSVIRATGSFWLALPAAALAIGMLGLLIESGLLRRVRGRPMSEILLTVGLSFIAADLALAIWGGDPITLDVPAAIDGRTQILGVTYPVYRLCVVALGIAVAVGLWALLERTRIGAMVRAGVDDREMAEALGINVKLVFTGVFVLGAMLAGLAGVVGAAYLSLSPGADTQILTYALVVVVVGGMGSLRGAVFGALLVGLIYIFGQALVPNLAYFVLFAPMALVLIVRPQGLFGRAGCAPPRWHRARGGSRSASSWRCSRRCRTSSLRSRSTWPRRR